MKLYALLVAGTLLAGCATNDGGKHHQDALAIQFHATSRQNDALRSELQELRDRINRICFEESPSGQVVLPCSERRNNERATR